MADPKPRSQLGIFQIPILTAAIIWACFLLEFILPGPTVLGFGLVPRTLSGMWGILGMPFIHANWAHLISNTIPLLVLTTLLAVTGKGWNVMGGIVALNGVLLWLFGRGGRVHVGASGLVYGLALYLICRGFVERKIILVIVSIFVMVLYGTVLLSGILPNQTGVSWDGHLCGGIAGTIVAFQLKKKPLPAKA